MQTVIDFLTGPAASPLVLAILGFVVSLVLKSGFAKKHELERCVLAFESAVQEVYEIYIKGIKDASSDGKLTVSEREEAREKAYSLAKQILAEEGIDLAKYYGPRISKAIIEKIVRRSKTAAKLAKGVLNVGEASG